MMRKGLPFVEHIWIAPSEHRFARLCHDGSARSLVVLTDKYFAWRSGDITASISSLSSSALQYNGVKLSEIRLVEFQWRHCGFEETMRIHVKVPGSPHDEVLVFHAGSPKRWGNVFRSLGVPVVVDQFYSDPARRSLVEKYVIQMLLVVMFVCCALTTMLSLLFDARHFVRNTGVIVAFTWGLYLAVLVYAYAKRK